MENKYIIVGGGCFWCIEAIFDQVKGVSSVQSGYAGGSVKNPSYREVCSGTTGHAEVVKITYDPSIISFSNLVEIFLVNHDPTTLNRQGADRGTQYRSIVFYANQEEKEDIQNAINLVQPYYDDPIVTEVAPLTEFYPAEDEHNDYYKNNPQAAYCQIVIAPKVAKLRKSQSEFLKANE